MQRIAACLVACIAVLYGALAPQAASASYPDRMIRIIVPYNAGSSTDAGARVLAAKLGALLKQTVIIENRPGNIGVTGTQECSRAAPDGYTLCYIADGQAVTMPAGYAIADRKLPYENLTPLSFVADSHFVFVVKKGLPPRFDAFIAHLRANPDKFACGWGNPTGKLGVGLLNILPGVRVASVPGGQQGELGVHQTLLTGDVQCAFSTMLTAWPHINSGAELVLGSVGTIDNPFYDKLPALGKSGYPNFGRLPTWYGFFAPAGLPRGVQETLYRAVDAVLADKEVIAHFRANGHTIKHGGPEALANQVRAQFDDTLALMRETGIRIVD